MQAKNYPKKHQQDKPKYDVFAKTMITMKIHLKMSEVGNNTKMNLERKIVQRTEGKCIPEGYVHPTSVKLISYSSGVVKMNMIEFQVVFECSVCNPVEGMIVSCVTRSITKAGIHADVLTPEGYLPMKIFVARDHNYSNASFGSIKENAHIDVRIVGKRFELNDAYIVAIASLIESSRGTAATSVGRQKITVLEPTEEEDVLEDYDVQEPYVVSVPRNDSAEEGEIAE